MSLSIIVTFLLDNDNDNNDNNNDNVEMLQREVTC